MLDILYDRGPTLVVNKPPGIATQAPPGIDCLEERVRAFYREREGKAEGKLYLGVPHRIDRPVSGAIVFARHVRAARRLAEQFERREVEKVYWAIVEGEVPEESGTWTDLVRKVPNEPRAEVVAEGTAEGKLAVLHYRVLERAPGRTRLEICLETGRMHQIRVQAAARGWPVVGDQLYGSRELFGPQADDPRARWIALHARVLAFADPTTREPVRVEARPPW